MDGKWQKFQTMAKHTILSISMPLIFVMVVIGLAIGRGVAMPVLWSFNKFKERGPWLE